MRILLALVVLTSWISAYAGVNLKNGNFYISYTDVAVYHLGKKLDLTRTYNSKSTETGTYGFGWGFEYDTRLFISGDGSILLKINGNGGSRTFLPVNRKHYRVNEAVDILLKAAKDHNWINNNPVEVMNFVHKLRTGEGSRQHYWKKFVENGWIEPLKLRGRRTYTSEEESGEIRYRRGQFTWERSKNEFLVFDEEGFLIRIERKHQDTEIIKRNRAGLIYLIKKGKTKVRMDYNDRGLLSAMWEQGKKSKATIKIDDRGDLVYVKDAGGNHTFFTYDEAHNLIKVENLGFRAKENGKVEAFRKHRYQMSYEPATYYCSQVIDKDYDTLNYEYNYHYDALGRKNDDHYFTTVTKRGFNGKLVKNIYDYEIRTDINGNRYSYKISTRINGIKTVTTYNSAGLPIRKERGRSWTRFEYNNLGLMIEKESSRGDLVKLKYDSKLKKIIEVDKNGKITRFAYDKDANLTWAANGKDTVQLIYNRKGKITTMITNDSELKFEYNDIGKPVKIVMVKEDGTEGSINVTYDERGEIEKVKSDDGHKMALQVTQAFQKLLSIVKPAGVNLNM